MKTLAAIAVAFGIGFATQVTVASPSATTAVGGKYDVVEHGGGCRKSSPPGMCCHMDNSTGIVHCH